MHVPKLHRIRIERFRRIQKPLELGFTSPRGVPLSTIVLAGPNGCGKTSVLEAVLLGLGQDALLVRDEEPKEREVSWRNTLPEGARIELTVSLDDGPAETWVRTRESFTIQRTDGTVEHWPPDTSADLQVEYFSSWRWPLFVGAVQPLAPGRRPGLKEANRLWRVKQRIADERARLGFQQSVLPGTTTSKADDWLRRINEIWSQFRGRDGTHIDAVLVEPKGEDEGLRADLFVMKDGEQVCSVDQLSSGEIELLTLADWFVIRGVRSALIVIDEPELHFHAQWQASIVRALRDLAPEAQFIFGTHSPIIWDQAYGFERFLLVPDDDPRSREWRESHPTSGEGNPS